MLQDGTIDIAPGKVAFVVTHLEMTAAPPARALPSVGEIRRVQPPDVAWYLDLYRRIGAPWLWFSRLALPTAALQDIILDPRVEVFALTVDGRDEGLLELDFRVDGACEIAFFGLTAGLIGKGAGRQLMNRAIGEAWRRPIRRLWVHTCTGDHPGAVEFYVRSGFTAYKRQIEIADDPRLLDLLPRAAAAHVPVIAAIGSGQ